MKNEIYDNMLSAYGVTTEQERRNAIFEANQQVILAGLYNGGFFDVAAFYGGTCLRIFHGLQRFSEDMDFSLLTPNDKFDFTKYFQPIIDEFAIVGREVEIKKKDKKSFGKVESAFLKDNTDVYDVSFQTDKSIKIKIEVDGGINAQTAAEAVAAGADILVAGTAVFENSNYRKNINSLRRPSKQSGE